MSTHENEFVFESNNGLKVDFKYNNDNIITHGQDFNGVTTKDTTSKTKCTVTVKAGRKGSSRCADWYKQSVNNNKNHMIHTGSGEHSPSNLNFAIKGILTIDTDSYEVCLGQGHNKNSQNNWHLASIEISSDSNGKQGDISNKYTLKQDGQHTIQIYTF